MIVYLITNIVNGKQYVGQTVKSLKDRWKFHCSIHSGCLAMKSAINKYGKNNFIIEPIYVSSSLEELNKKEEEYVKQYNTLVPNVYNLMSGGDRPTMSEESKRKMSIAKKGRPAWNKGLTKEDPRVASHVQYGSNNGAYGKSHHNKPHSEQSKKKISNAKIGSVWSEETRKAMSKSKKRNKQKVPVICLETGKIYEAISYAAKDLGINSGGICNAMSGGRKRKTAGGYTFARVSS
jgi:group I intron endonuclease